MAWIDLQDAKKQLNKSLTNTTDDYELLGYIDAACATVEDLKGHVEPAFFTETRPGRNADRNARGGGSWFVEVSEYPLLEVDTVTLDGADLDPSTYRIDGDLVRVPGPGQYTVSYLAGLDEPPPNFRLAALELISHLWRASQLNANSGRPPVGGDQMMILPGSASALPYRVRELLGLYGAVVSDHVVIA